jgi:hypothetical protein
MSLQIYQSKSSIQIPIRIDETLHQKFIQIADSTQIPKSKLTRIGLEILFRDIQQRGISYVLNEYKECIDKCMKNQKIAPGYIQLEAENDSKPR